jgi:hypothetical protein
MQNNCFRHISTKTRCIGVPLPKELLSMIIFLCFVKFTHIAGKTWRVKSKLSWVPYRLLALDSRNPYKLLSIATGFNFKEFSDGIPFVCRFQRTSSKYSSFSGWAAIWINTANFLENKFFDTICNAVLIKLFWFACLHYKLRIVVVR